MTHYKLTYFDIDGGRGEAIRIALHAAGIPFEDHRISFREFPEIRQRTPFHCIPVLEIDGEPFTQSNAIERYIGKMANLYPDDPLQALYCDETLGAIEDLTHQVVRTFGLEGDELEAARENLVSGWLTVFLVGLERLLKRGGGEYFADGALTVADLRVFIQTRGLRSGFLDHVPTDIVERLAPALVEHEARVAADPRVADYYETRRQARA